VVNQVHEIADYKVTEKLCLCIEDIIQAFSDGDITCKDCRKLVADIISDRLLAGHEVETREPDVNVNQFEKHSEII
jgi:hypothetical protein